MPLEPLVLPESDFDVEEEDGEGVEDDEEDEEDEEDEDASEPLDELLPLEVDADEAERESVMYQPLPLNTMPTG